MEGVEIDFGLICDEPDLIARCESLCKEYNFSIKKWDKLDTYLEDKGGYRFIFASLKDFNKKESAAELAQAIRYVSHDGFINCTVSGSLATESAQFAKKSGADLILLREEVLNTSKLEFAVLQVIKTNYLPIKVSDLLPNVEIPLNVYHLMPQRRKFMPVVREGELLSEAKFAKCKEVGELYIKRPDAGTFSKFVASHPDQTAAGLARRCRAEYLALYASFTSLVFLLTDQSEQASFKQGKELLEKCQQLCGALLGTLGEFGDAWDVINNSSIGELGSAERSPAVAALAGLFGLVAEIDNIDQMMVAALLADIGLVLLPPTILAKLREEKTNTFTPQELKQYENYPNLSLDILLNRKIALEEKMRLVLTSTQERADAKGFPRKPNANKIPLASQIIHFSREFDRRTMLVMGRPRPDREKIKKEMWEEDGQSFQIYTSDFWRVMKPILLKPGT